MMAGECAGCLNSCAVKANRTLPGRPLIVLKKSDEVSVLFCGAWTDTVSLTAKATACPHFRPSQAVPSQAVPSQDAPPQDARKQDARKQAKRTQNRPDAKAGEAAVQVWCERCGEMFERPARSRALLCPGCRARDRRHTRYVPKPVESRICPDCGAGYSRKGNNGPWPSKCPECRARDKRERKRVDRMRARAKAIAKKEGAA